MGKPTADPEARNTGLPFFLVCLTGGLLSARFFLPASPWILALLVPAWAWCRFQPQDVSQTRTSLSRKMALLLGGLLALQLGLMRGADRVPPPPLEPGQTVGLAGQLQWAGDQTWLHTRDGWRYPLSLPSAVTPPAGPQRVHLQVRVSPRRFFPTAESDPRPLGLWARQQGPWLRVQELWWSAPPDPGPALWRAAARRHLFQRILPPDFESDGPPSASPGLSAALLLGHRQDLPAGTRLTFQRAGLSHILALSGLHAMVFLGLLALASSLLPRPLRWPLQAGGLLLFLALVEVRASLWRAGFLALAWLVCNRLGYRPKPVTLLFWAAAAELFLFPLHAFDLGFQMSYAACLGIVLLLEPLKDLWLVRPLPGWLKVPMACGLGASLGVLPLSLYHFQGAHPLSFLTTLLALPFVLLMFFGGLLQGLGLPGGALLLETATGSLLQTAALGGHLAPDWAFQASPPLWLLLFVPALLLFWRVSRERPGYHLAGNVLLLMGLAALFVLRSESGLPKQHRLTLFDVGQGQAVLLEMKTGERFLVDTGGSWSNPAGPLTRTVLPRVLRRGAYLDGLFISHSDLDHAGGLEQALQRFEVGTLYLPRAPDERLASFARMAERYGVPVVYLGAGMQWQGKGWRLQVLGPGAGDRRARRRAPQKISLNELSLVLRLKTRETSLLLPGDVGRIKELDLMQHDGLQSDVLVLGHHGSGHSSHPDFLNLVDPKLTLCSAGAGNRYGHPAPKVVQQLKERSIRLLSTPARGTITLELGPKLKWVSSESCSGLLNGGG